MSNENNWARSLVYKVYLAYSSLDNLSPEEVRLYLLLVICADEIRGVGRLSSEVIERCLGER